METEKKGKGEKIVRILGGILLVFFLIILVIIKLNSPSFKLGTFIVVTILVILFFVGVIVAYHFWSKRKLDRVDEKISGKLPAPATIEACRELAKMQLKNPIYADYPDGAGEELNEFLGKTIKSWVYTFTTTGVYTGQKYVIIMNRHYPDSTLNVLIDPDNAKINRVKNNCAFMPEDSPSIEETKVDDLLTGRSVTTRKEIHVSEEEKSKKQKEDL